MSNAYFHALLITLIQQCLSIMGIIFNCALIWITIKNRNLHTSSGYLLAIYSLGETFLESATFLPTVLVILNKQISFLTCLYVSSVQAFWGGTTANFAIFFLSLDRLVAVLFPIFYHKVLRKGAVKYVFLLNAISSLYIFTIIYFNISYAVNNTMNSTYCEPGDQITQQIYAWIYNTVIFITFLAVINYIILGFLIKCSKQNSSDDSQHTRKIFKSLAIIMSVIFFGYISGFFSVAWIVPLLTSDPEMAFFYHRLTSQLITIAGAINAPVLYLCSNQYRSIFNQQFPIVKKIYKKFEKQSTAVIVLAQSTTMGSALNRNNLNSNV